MKLEISEREREIDNGTVVELTAANKFERRQGKQLFLFLLLLRYPGQDSWGGGGRGRMIWFPRERLVIPTVIRKGYGLYSIENTRGKSIVASARFVDPWACAPCAAYIGIRDGWIHPLRRKWRCTMMGDVFYDRVYLFKVFFFLGRKGRVVIQQRIFLSSVLKYDEQQFLNNFSPYALSLRCFRDIGEKIAATFLR